MIFENLLNKPGRDIVTIDVVTSVIIFIITSLINLSFV